MKRRRPNARVPHETDYTVDSTTGCWNWTGKLTRYGYGRVCNSGTRQNAHRFYYEMYVTTPPRGWDVDHLCRNRACVNPAHLEAVPRAVNIQRGAGAVLTAADVMAIRLLGSGEDRMTGVDLAAIFDSSPRNISSILAGRTWHGVLAVTPEEVDLAQRQIRSRAGALLRRARALRIAGERVRWSPTLFDVEVF